MRALIIVFVLVAFLPLNAQESGSKTGLSLYTYFDRLLNDTLRDPARPKLINYPTIAYSPETRWELGVSSLYIYSAKNDLSNRLSELKAFTFYTLENQYGLWLDHAVYTDENLWFIPSVKTKTDNSIPFKNSSITTVDDASPNFWLATISSSSFLASSKEFKINTPFPAEAF